MPKGEGMYNKLLDEEKRGVKLTIIDEHDYTEYREICNAILKLGYKAIVTENGSTIFEKEEYNE